MRFTLIDPEDPAREFSIIVDVSKQDYSGMWLNRDDLRLSLIEHSA